MDTQFDMYFEKYGERFLEQLELEAQAHKEAHDKMVNAISNTEHNGTAGESRLGTKFISYAWEETRNNIEIMFNPPKKRGAKPKHAQAVDELKTIYEGHIDELIDMVTLVGLSTCISHLMSRNGTTATTLASSIGKAVLKEASIRDFFNKFPEEEKLVEGGLEKRVGASYKTAYALNTMRIMGYLPINWDDLKRKAFGTAVLDMIIRGSGFFTVDTVEKRNKSYFCIVPTDFFVQAWETNKEQMGSLAKMLEPTIIPPKPWNNPWDGGYYGDSLQFTSLLRLPPVQNAFMSSYKQKLDTIDLDFVYKALNAMQETPFVINKQLVSVINEIIESGGNLGGIPTAKPYELLPRLPEGTPEEDIKAHKRQQVAIIKRETRRKSQLLRVFMVLSLATKFKDYSAIYFPWNMDYRGRCYPLPSGLSPQGDDLSKSLLLFANPSECKDANDWRWLAIHGANLAGHDKVSFDERIQWILDNEDKIVASAKDPLSYTWWSAEAENDYPLEFLAFCFEWTKWMAYRDEHGNDARGFKCPLVLAFDGTCSGLQHFSGLLRDEIGGYAVNLTPTDKVQDIYSIVAEKVNDVLMSDAVNGTTDGYKTDKKGKIVEDKNGKPLKKLGTKTMAQGWLMFAKDKYGSEGITRKVCKRSVMTLAYGSERYGFKENLLADIIKPYMMANPDTHPFIAPTQMAVYLAGLIWDAVSTTVVKAVEGMKYLQDIAKVVSGKGYTVNWVTPNGLAVQENYMKIEVKDCYLYLNGAQHRIYIVEESGNVDKVKQAQGISPNFIHSLDATHMQRVVVHMVDEGDTNFAMVHDSFGTDMAHAGLLYRVVREEFVKLYEGHDWLQEFTDGLKQYLTDEEIAELPPRPSFGNLDLQQVLHSDFCFA